jgi:transposase
MQGLLKQATRVADQRRIQAVLMRALDASPPGHIAAVTGLSVNTVRIIHSRFLRDGEAFLTGRPGRGGRRRTLLSDTQAKALLAQHRKKAGEGQMLEIKAFKQAMEKSVGHAVHASTAYRLLAKAGWRKIVPRPKHPAQQPNALADFKKATRKSSAKKPGKSR